MRCSGVDFVECHIFLQRIFGVCLAQYVVAENNTLRIIFTEDKIPRRNTLPSLVTPSSHFSATIAHEPIYAA